MDTTNIPLALRVMAGSLGTLALLVAWFVYETEEKRLQSKLEALWVSFDDLHRRAASWHKAFIRVVAEHGSMVLTAVFGTNLLSERALGTAMGICTASYLLIVGLGSAALPRRGYVEIGMGFAAVGLGVGLLTFFARRVPLPPRALRFVVITLGLVLILALFIPYLFFVLDLDAPDGPERTMAYLFPVVILGGLLAGVTATLLAVLLGKAAVTWVVVRGEEWPLLAYGVFMLLIPTILLAAIAYISQKYNFDPPPLVSACLFLIGTGILFSFASLIICGLLTFIALLMGLHRVTWPIFSRLLYMVPRHYVVSNKKFLNSVGFAGLVLALVPASGWKLLLKAVGAA